MWATTGTVVVVVVAALVLEPGCDEPDVDELHAPSTTAPARTRIPTRRKPSTSRFWSTGVIRARGDGEHFSIASTKGAP